MTNEDNVAWRLGRKIARLRNQKGWSQERLGDELDFGRGPVSQPTVSEIEHGTRRINADELGQFARALSVTTPELIDGLGYTGEPLSVTGGGKVGTEGRGNAAT